ncbi:(R)-1-hydroxy-2-aminoethylphosphonate ammonia-lyase [Pararhodospirillum oryzae]|uniref:Aspartate aminotransferase family protein n=1 Tax=Pararhodospirillum oryzae TaxID=478448 RepID=A0A512H876_9PROT|nr:aspartate aminotransferase family protein [Pararhodospirillum oryzae]GEO81655.1 aspartate aminotransferase family protein [Pararhodospirillum oryzae]
MNSLNPPAPDFLGEGDGNLSPAREAWAGRYRGPQATALVARDAAVFLPQALSTPCLSAIRAAEGAWLTDADGRRLLDFHGNAAHTLGYGHPRLLAALRDQMTALSFSPRRYTNEVAVLLGERLRAVAPQEDARILLTTGGSDAIEVALKLARLATGRFKTLSFWDAFHGAGFGAASVGGEAHFRSHGLGPLLPGTAHVAPFACYRCPYGHADNASCGLACAAMIRYVLEREGDVAAVIAEPARAVPTLPPPGFWPLVREACTAHGALLIFDEIPTGLGRTGHLFASDAWNVVPDITVLGKGLGGGVLPVAAVVARGALAGAVRAVSIGHYTHEKNPLLARAALTTLEILLDEDLPARARALGAHALARLDEMKARHALIGDVRGLGLLLGVEVVADRETRAPDPAAAERVLYHALARGLSFKVSLGNVLTLMPPLTIDQADLDRALDILDVSLAQAAGGNS